MHATETGDNSGGLLGSSSVPQVVEENSLLCYTLKYYVHVIMLKVLGQSACRTSDASWTLNISEKKTGVCLCFYLDA